MTTKVKKLPYPIVEVAWVDSEHDADWSTLTELKESQDHTLECRTAGFLVLEKDDRYVLATSIGMAKTDIEEQVSAYITIPKQAVLWIKGLPKKAQPKAAKEKIEETQSTTN